MKLHLTTILVLSCLIGISSAVSEGTLTATIYPHALRSDLNCTAWMGYRPFLSFFTDGGQEPALCYTGVTNIEGNLPLRQIRVNSLKMDSSRRHTAFNNTLGQAPTAIDNVLNVIQTIMGNIDKRDIKVNAFDTDSDSEKMFHNSMGTDRVEAIMFSKNPDKSSYQWFSLLKDYTYASYRPNCDTLTVLPYTPSLVFLNFTFPFQTQESSSTLDHIYIEVEGIVTGMSTYSGDRNRSPASSSRNNDVVFEDIKIQVNYVRFNYKFYNGAVAINTETGSIENFILFGLNNLLYKLGPQVFCPTFIDWYLSVPDALTQMFNLVQHGDPLEDQFPALFSSNTIGFIVNQIIGTWTMAQQPLPPEIALILLLLGSLGGGGG